MKSSGIARIMNGRSSLRVIGAVLGLAALYLILAALFTRPLISNLVATTPRGSGSGDQCQTIWFFWWTKMALFDLHQNPFWTGMIYAPYGTGVGYHISLLTNLLAILVSWITGAAINSPYIYNVLVLGSLVVTGLATFALIRYVVRNSLAAFLGSLFVMFSPYCFFHLDHLNLISIGWGIGSIYFAIRFLDLGRTSHLAWAVLLFIAQFYMSLTNAMLVACFILFYLILSARSLFSDRRRKSLLFRGLGGIALAALLSLPLLVSLRECGSVWQQSWHDSVPHSAQLLDFVRAWNHPGQPDPGEGYSGWLLILPAAFTLLYVRKRANYRWAILGGIFLVLSLGPTLVMGERQILAGWMPYRWLYELVPYFDLSRTPTRFAILSQLSLAMVVSFGIAAAADALRQLRNGALRRLVSGAGGVLVVVAIYLIYVREPIVLSLMYVPPVYQEVAADSTIKTICNLPIAEKLQICNWYMYWQTTHGRKEVNGYLTHHSSTATPLLDSIKTWPDFGPDQKAQLRAAGVDAVVLHRPQQESELIRLK